jgi:pilus assembly protein CpaF
MQFWLYDPATNTRRTIDTNGGGDSFVVGRDSDCGIVLDSPFVARRHARLYRKGNQFFVEALGRAGTRVANREVAPQQPVRFDFGDEIQIGPFSLAMIAPGRKGDGDRRAQERDRQAALMAFEEQVHSQLLERMNLRLTGYAGKADAAYVEQVLLHLEDVLQREVDALDPSVVEHTVRVHLSRLVLAEVVRQGQGRVQTDYRVGDERFLDPQKEQAVSQLVATLVDSMPLLFEPDSVSEDLAAAEDSLDGLLSAEWPAIPVSLRKYLVRRTVAKDIQDVLFGLGPLQDLIEMPSVSEIMVVGRDRVYVEKSGVVQPTTRSFFSDEVLLSIIERILTPVGRRVDTSTPMVDARLPDGSRVNVIVPPLSLVGPCLTIRKFGWMPFTMDDLIERGSISGQVAAFLQGCVTGRKNIVISGGTGSGKTTLLNVLGAYARSNERIVTIEESAELKLPQPHVVALEGRPANVEGSGAYTIRDLVRNALRMRPDRIIVGEVRGPEALDMLQAMNTGHDGALSTLHANTPHDATKRLETLVLMGVEMPMPAIREQIVGAVDLIVQVTRFANGRRRITHVSEVVGVDPDTGHIRLEDIYTLRDPDQPQQRFTGYVPSFAEEMIARQQINVEVFL